MELITELVNFILHLDVHLNEIIKNFGIWTYLILFLIIFLETGVVITPFLPGDSLLFAAGSFAALGSLNVFVLAITLTFLMRFCVQYAFAMLAFWTERAHAVEQLWYLPYLFLSGLLIPLDNFPPGLREALLTYTPFPYLIHFPSKVLMGGMAWDAILQGYAITAAWAVIFFGVHQVLWRVGLRKYSAMGA